MREIKMPSKTAEENEYDDHNIPEIDLPGKASVGNIIPDEVPRRDGDLVRGTLSKAGGGISPGQGVVFPGTVRLLRIRSRKKEAADGTSRIWHEILMNFARPAEAKP